MTLKNNFFFQSLIIGLILVLLYFLASMKFNNIEDEYLKKAKKYPKTIQSFYYNFDDTFPVDSKKNIEPTTKVLIINKKYAPITTLTIGEIENYQQIQSITATQMVKVKNRGDSELAMVLWIKDKKGETLNLNHKIIEIPSEIENKWYVYSLRFLIKPEYLLPENSIKLYYWNIRKGNYLVDDLGIKVNGIIQ